MTHTPPPPSPSRPLDVGDVINAGFRLYGAHLKQYLGISLRASLWTLLPILALIPLLPLSLGLLAPAAEPSPMLILGSLLALPLFLVLLVYGLAKSLTNAALITRLAFGELLGQPESATIAQRQVQPKVWNFLLVAVLLGLIFFGITIAALVVTGLFLGIPLGILVSMAGGTIEGNVLALIAFILIAFLLLLIFLIVGIWLLARLWFPEVPLAIEDRLSASASIGRCWHLTQNYAWRIALIISVAFCVTIPISLIVQVLTSILQQFILIFIAENSPFFAAMTILLGNILSILSGIFTLPFWQAIKAVIYYDLRARKEGLDLRFRDRDSEI